MKKYLRFFLILLGAILIIFAGLFGWFCYEKYFAWKKGIDFSCVEKIEERAITGHSLEPLIIEETKVKGLEGYYDCNPIQKGEIVIVKFKTREEDFVKKIVGLPGDKLEFTEESQLKLNDEILKNSAAEPYLFSEGSQRIITIPLRETNIIPEGLYFVLSDEKGPTAFDSRQYGFIQKDHLKGRIIY